MLSVLIDDSYIIRPYIIAYSAFHKQSCIIIITMRVIQRLINIIVAPPSATLAKHWIDGCLFLSSSFNMPRSSHSLLNKLMIMFTFFSLCGCVSLNCWTRVG